MTSKTIVNVELLVRDGAPGKQAMWAAFRHPVTQKIVSVWGSVTAADGSIPRIGPGLPLTTTLAFGQSKEVNVEHLAFAYNKKSRKYESVGRFELDIDRLHLNPIGTQDAVDHEVKAQAAKAESRLPKSLTHPESMGSGRSAGASWFF